MRTPFAVSAHLRHRAHHAAPSKRVRREFRGLHVQFSLSFPRQSAVVAQSSGRRSGPRWIASAANDCFHTQHGVFRHRRPRCVPGIFAKDAAARSACAPRPRQPLNRAHMPGTGVLNSNLRSQLFRRTRNSDLPNSRMKPASRFDCAAAHEENMSFRRGPIFQ